MVSIDELKARFGPALNVAPFGECIVIQGDKFDPDWEVSLGDKGYTCHFTDFDGHAVTLIQLKKAVAEGKVVYVPPKKPEPAVIPEVYSNDVEVKETEKVEKKVYALQGPRWTIAEKTELLKEYDRLVAEGKKYGSRIILAELPQFKGRSKNGIDLQLKHLLKKRRAKGEVAAVPQVEKVEDVEKVEAVEPVEAQSKPKEKAVMGWKAVWKLEEDSFLIELWNRQPRLAFKDVFVEFHAKFPKRPFLGVERRLFLLRKGKIQARFKKTKRKSGKATNGTSAIKSEKSTEAPGPEVVSVEKPASRLADVLVDLVTSVRMLIEANDSLNKAYVELKGNFEGYVKINNAISEVHGDNLENLKVKNEKLQKEFALHKHADKTGEAMLPMEGSS
jgi:hypothetical protein